MGDFLQFFFAEMTEILRFGVVTKDVYKTLVVCYAQEILQQTVAAIQFANTPALVAVDVSSKLFQFPLGWLHQLKDYSEFYNY